MAHILKEVASKAHEAIWFLVLVGSVWLAKSAIHATPVEISLGVAVFLSAYVLYLFLDAYRNVRTSKIFPWLYSTSGSRVGKSLPQIEGAVQEKSTIFVVTPDLHNDAWEKQAIDSVESNLRKGCRYIYVTKDSDSRSRSNAEMIQRNFQNYYTQIDMYAINDLFDHLPTYNILILERDKYGVLRVFVELPVTERVGEKVLRSLWAEADANLATRWHEKILDTIKGRVPIPNGFARAA